MRIIVSHSSLKGKRPTNEDELLIIRDKKVSSFAIFDGHGGKFVSGFLKKKLTKYLKLTSKIFDKTVVRSVFRSVNQELIKNHPREAKSTGSTALLALIKGKQILIANTGDCRAVICRNGLAIPLTKDHKPSWPEEKKRIQKLKGKVTFDGRDWRIKDLSVSRAFGDLDTVPFITYKPELFTYSVTKDDKFMILACDGLWDVIDNQDAVQFVLANKRQSAKKLADYALKKGSTDNISIIIAFFY